MFKVSFFKLDPSLNHQVLSFNSTSKVLDAVFKDNSIFISVMYDDQSSIIEQHFILVEDGEKIPNYIIPDSDKKFNLVPIKAFYEYMGADDTLCTQLFYCLEIV